VDDAVLDDRLDRRGRRDGVQVRAEEERRSRAAGGIDPAVEVSDRRSDRRAGVVLVDRQP
jgi:hypothetical protein